MKSFSRATPSFATFSAISAALRVESGAKEDLGMVAGGPPLSSEIQRKSRAISSENAGFSRIHREIWPKYSAAGSRVLVTSVGVSFGDGLAQRRATHCRESVQRRNPCLIRG